MIVETLALIPHSATPPKEVQGLDVSLQRERGRIVLTYVVACPTSRLVLPAPAKPYRAEGLWRTTCFELFVRDPGPRYREFNFSPSSQWALYGFDAYREGMEALPVDVPPSITLWDEGYALGITVGIELPSTSGLTLGLSAIVEETDGPKSYWALAHPPGDPDFHHPDCFALKLPPLV